MSACDAFARLTTEQKAQYTAKLMAWQRDEFRKLDWVKKKIARRPHRVRKARIKENGGRHTGEQAAALLEAQNWLCVKCDADLKVVRKEKDHIRPVAKGGSNDIANIQWLCMPCNRKKSASWVPANNVVPSAPFCRLNQTAEI